MRPLNIKLINHQLVLMPWEHTSVVTQKGTLKSEVRTLLMIHHSDIWSVLVLKISVYHTLKLLLFALRYGLLCVTQRPLGNQSTNTTLFVYNLLILRIVHDKNNTDYINSVFKPTK